MTFPELQIDTKNGGQTRTYTTKEEIKKIMAAFIHVTC